MYDLVLKEGMWHEIAFSEGKTENTVVNQTLKFNIWHITLKKKYTKLITPSVVKIKNTDGQNFKSRMMILSDEVENQEKKKKTKTGQQSHSLKWSKN